MGFVDNGGVRLPAFVFFFFVPIIVAILAIPAAALVRRRAEIPAYQGST